MFKSLLDTSGFPPRWYCGSGWTEILGWIHIVSDILIFISYVSIPLAIFIYSRSIQKKYFKNIFWLFILFIFFCGLIHLIEATLFWSPWYRLSALVKFITAIISIITSFYAFIHLPRMLKIPQELEFMNYLEYILIQIPQPLMIIKEDCTVQFCNIFFEKYSGFTKEELCNNSCIILFPPLLQIEMMSRVNKVILTQQSEIIKFKFQKKDKSQTEVEMHLVFCDYHNKKEIMIAIKDLEQSKQIELITKKLNAIFNRAADGIITCANSIIQSYNDSAENIFKYSPDEIIGKDINILIKQLSGEFTNSKIYNDKYEIEGVTKYEETIPLEISIGKVNIDSELILIIIIRDITERKIAELSIKNNKAKLQAILDTTVDGIVTLDSEGTIECFNHACERIFGYRSEEAISQNIKIFIPELYCSEYDNGAKKIIELDREATGKRKDGTSFSLELAFSEVNLGDRKIYSGIIRDITRRKELENHRQELINNLVKSNEDLERFAYICSHDLQEPLRMVCSYTQKFEQYLSNLPNANLLDEKALKYMHFIVNGASRAQVLIEGILNYSSLGFEHKLEIVDLNEVIKIILDDFASLINEKEAIIKCDILPKIIGNKVLQLQLFQNLISNAIKYSKARPKIHIKYKDMEDDILFSVEDNGIGMDSEYTKKIFDVFFRLHSNSEYKGSGIGLAICKKIIEKHDGKIWAESEIGKGTVFYFILPKIN